MENTVLFLCDIPANVQRVYHARTLDTLPGNHQVYTKQQILENAAGFQNIRWIFSTWGMPRFTEAEIKTTFPSLEAVFYAAGSVQGFAREFLNCGVKVYSAWAANAIPVAEYTVAQILLSMKGFFPASVAHKAGDHAAVRDAMAHYPGNFGGTVGIIGAGMIGRKVIELLKPFALHTVVFDPFLPDETARELGTRRVSLEELFAVSQVVSNHLANNPQTQGILKKEHFASMLPYATFINTGRGAQVVEADLAEVLAARPDLWALLDVTDPEPPVAGHPFYTLPNCILTPHIAGSMGHEVERMGEYMAEAYRATIAGEPCRFEVTLPMLATMA